jgi:hypothetical protein
MTEVNKRLRIGFYPERALSSFPSKDQLVGDMQEVFSCIDSDSILKSSSPHRHIDPVVVTDSFIELIEEVPVHVCKVNDNTVDGCRYSFHMPYPRDFFHEFQA